MNDETLHWHEVATKVAIHKAGVGWTEAEIEMNKNCSCNTEGYMERKDSIVRRFFNMITDFGGPNLAPLSTQYTDDFGNERQ